MGLGTGTGRGGKRPSAGRRTAIPTGEGEKMQITVAIGEEVLTLLRAKYPGLTDQDTVRAGLWDAVGVPVAAPIEAPRPSGDICPECV